MDDFITIDQLIDLRRRRYRQAEGTHICSESEALDFINGLGFVWLINLSDADLPSLHFACPKPYKKETRHPGEQVARTWWDSKQTFPGRKECYYAKVLRGRGTFMSWECFPLMYAVYVAKDDYRDAYRRGLLPSDDKRVMDLIAASPEISSPELRRQFGPVGKPVTRALDRSLQNLQETCRITCAGGSIEGWTIHNWATVEYWVPEEYLSRSREVDSVHAKKELILRYLRMAVAASVGDIAWVFRWNRKEVTALVKDLLSAGSVREIEVIGLLGDMYAPVPNV